MKKTIDNIDVKNKKIIVRCDLNVPISNGKITDDQRIVASLPTLKKLSEEGAKVIVLSHLGRPKGEANREYSLGPVAQRMGELLGQTVRFLQSDKVIDENVIKEVANIKAGEIVLLENTRFRKEETENNSQFSKELASLGEVFVNDAFGTSHRAHSSTAGIAEYLPAVSGYLIKKEIKYLGEYLDNPKRPFVAIMGGAKVGDKIKVIEALLDKADTVIIGGGMTYTFLKAMGYEIGNSILDEPSLSMAKELIEKSKETRGKLVFPLDVLCGEEFSNKTNTKVFDSDNMPSGMMGLDIGPKAIKQFTEIIHGASTIVWNGPMGVFEMPSFEKGTKAIANAMYSSKGITVIGGGDSAAAIAQFEMEDGIDHISTGGGASLEFLEGKDLPGIVLLEDL